MGEWALHDCCVISGPYFPVFGLDAGGCGPEIAPCFGTFRAVNVLVYLVLRLKFFLSPDLVYYAVRQLVTKL